MGRLTSLMAMGVSLTSHNNPLLRHLIPSTSCVSRYSSFRRTTLFRNVAFTQGYVGYSTTTNSDGSQHSDSEGKLDSENNNAARMVPPVGQTEVGETTVNQVPVPVPRAGSAAIWRELAAEIRAKNSRYPGYYETKIDNGGSSTTILNKEPTRVMQSGPVPSNNSGNATDAKTASISKKENIVNLTGFVDRPVRVMNTGPDRFGVFTMLRVEDSDNPLRCCRFFLKMWYGLARKCLAQLKPGDLIHVSGRLVYYSGSSDWQVLVSEFRYILGSKAPRPTSIHKEGKINSGTDHWCDLLDNPDDWYDYRASKQNGSVRTRHPDFVKKDGSVPLWLNKAPKEILPSLKGVTFGIPVMSKQKKRVAVNKNDVHLWELFFAKPDEWWDNRNTKKNPQQPDFKHRETGEALWLSSDTPIWVTKELEQLDKMKKAKKADK